MKKKLFNTRAEGYVDTAISVLALTLVFLIALSFFSVITQKTYLDMFSDSLLETACRSGRVDEEVSSRYRELVELTGIQPDYVFNCQYIQGTNKIQLGDNIEVIVTMNSNLSGLFGNLFQIELSSVGSSLSNVYWK